MSIGHSYLNIIYEENKKSQHQQNSYLDYRTCIVITQQFRNYNYLDFRLLYKRAFENENLRLPTKNETFVNENLLLTKLRKTFFYEKLKIHNFCFNIIRIEFFK